MASTDEVRRALRSLMKKLADAAPPADSFPDRTILCVVPDLDTAYRSDLRGSRFKDLKQAPTDDPTDIRITARSDDLVALIEGRLNVGFAFITGKIRVDAPASDLMMIRRLF